MTQGPDRYRKVVRPPLHPLNSIRIGCLEIGLLFSLHSGSLAILSPRRSGESCLSKDQREIPLMCPTKAN